MLPLFLPPLTRNAERLQKEIGIPLPEMIFGHNEVTISNETGFGLTFRAQEALELVDKTSESNKHIKVAYASEWGKKRYAPGAIAYKGTCIDLLNLYPQFTEP